MPASLSIAVVVDTLINWSRRIIQDWIGTQIYPIILRQVEMTWTRMMLQWLLLLLSFLYFFDDSHLDDCGDALSVSSLDVTKFHQRHRSNGSWQCCCGYCYWCRRKHQSCSCHTVVHPNRQSSCPSVPNQIYHPTMDNPEEVLPRHIRWPTYQWIRCIVVVDDGRFLRRRRWRRWSPVPLGRAILVRDTTRTRRWVSMDMPPQKRTTKSSPMYVAKDQNPPTSIGHHDSDTTDCLV